ncbi:MAG: polymer-forming cytoskeletal protein [Anaerolineales bacterium]|nr:polymer-forming cytoskeletal protein [Anaerolineales bacterium]
MKPTQNKITAVFLSALTLAVVMAISFTPAVHAGEFIEGGPDATVEEGEVIEDDLFIGGDDVLVAGVVKGDLFAAGQNVVISGEIYGNVYAAGQSVTISGMVEGSVMLGGYSLVLEDSAEIGRNVYFGGFSLEAEPESTIGRSLYGGGYQLVLAGEVVRDVTAGLGALQVTGPVGGDIKARVGEATDNSTYMFHYWSTDLPSVEILDTGANVDESQVAGEVDITITPVDTDLDEIEPTDFQISPAYLALQHMRRRTGEFIALLLVGGLLLWLMKDMLMKAVAEVRQHAGVDTLWGLLVYFLVFPVFFTLFIFLVMLTIAISLLTFGSLTGEIMAVSSLVFFGSTTLFGLLTSVVTKIIVGYLVGRWLLEKLTKLSFDGYWHHFAALASGVFLYELLRAIPFLGGLVAAAVILIGTGALFVLIKNAVQKKSGSASADAAVEVAPAE